MKNIRPPIRNSSNTEWGYVAILPSCAFKTTTMAKIYTQRRKYLRKLNEYQVVSSYQIFDIFKERYT